MLDALLSLATDFIFIFEKASDANFTQLPKKNTLLFASDKYLSSKPKLPTYFSKTFMLQPNRSETDQLQQFSTSEDLICQLVDEIYRCYCQEAEKYDKLGDFIISSRFERQGNRIHDEVRKAHNKVFKQESATISFKCPETRLVFLTKEGVDNQPINEILQNFDKVVDDIRTFSDENKCYLHLLKHEKHCNVFMIVTDSYSAFQITGIRYLTSIKSVYFFGNSSATDKIIFAKPYDLRRQLVYDLIAHYGQLGEKCRDQNCDQQSRDMFLKARNLCVFLL